VPYYHIDNGEYPGGYYDFMHLFVGDTANATVLATRWVSVCIAVLVWGALFWLLPIASRRLMGYAIMGAAIPLTVFLIPSNNPSGWAIVGVTACWLGWHGAATSSETWRQRALAGIALVGATIAATARADAGAYVGLVTVVLGFFHWPELRRNLRGNAVLLAAMAVALVVGAVGFLSGSQSSALESGLYQHAGRSPLGVLFENLMGWPAWWVSLWSGPLGWLDTATPGWGWVPAALVGLGLLFYGLGRTNWRKTCSVVAVLGAMVVLPLAIMQAGLSTWGDGGVQVRYILPLLPALLGLTIMRPDRQGAHRLSLAQDTVIAVGLSVAHAVTLYNLLRRYTVGLADGDPLNIGSAPEWWREGYPNPLVTWGISSVGFTLLLAAFFIWNRRTPDITDLDAGESQLLGESPNVLLKLGDDGGKLNAEDQQEEDGASEQQVDGQLDSDNIG
jgi:hypothetical protein